MPTFFVLLWHYCPCLESCLIKVGTKEKVEGADYAIEKIEDVKQAIPEIWDTRKTLSIYAIIRMIYTFIIAKFRSIFGFPRRLSF